jgi:PAS domain S-box-containing protein
MFRENCILHFFTLKPTVLYLTNNRFADSVGEPFTPVHRSDLNGRAAPVQNPENMKRNLTIVALTASLCLVVVYLTARNYYAGERERIAEFQKDQVSLARRVADQIESFFRDQARALQALQARLAPMPSLSYFLQKAPSEVETYCREEMERSYFRGVSLYDASGRVLYSSEAVPPALSGGAKKATSPKTDSEHGGEVVISYLPPRRSSDSSSPPLLFLISVPVRQSSHSPSLSQPENKLLGMLGMTVDLKAFLENELNSPTMKTASFWLLDKSGLLLFHSEHPQMVLRSIRERDESCTRCHVSFVHAERMLSEKRGAVEYRIRNQPRKVAAFSTARVANAAFVAVLPSDYDRLTARSRKDLRDHLILLSVMIVSLIAGSAWILRNDRLRIKMAEEARHWQSLLEERRKAEEVLRATESKCRVLVDYLPQKIFLKDVHSAYVYCNDNHAQAFLIKASEVAGKTDFDFYPSERARNEIDEDRRIMSSGRAEESDERSLENGREVIFHRFKMPVRDEAGAITGILGIYWDVTEKARLEAIAEAANTMNNIGYAFSGIRHEIGNPINTLKVTLSVLKNRFDVFSRETVKEYIDRAVAEIARMEYLLHSLKSFNMYEILHLQSFPVKSFIDDFLSLVAPDLKRKGIAFECSVDPGTGSASADPRALQQVLLNLISNATDAVEGREAPRVALNVFRNDGLVRLTLSDNGCGMSEDQQKDLFKPFRTSKPAGTGLGLVIVKKMLSGMKGTIRIASRKDYGTTVDISLLEGSDGLS